MSRTLEADEVLSELLRDYQEAEVHRVNTSPASPAPGKDSSSDAGRLPSSAGQRPLGLSAEELSNRLRSASACSRNEPYAAREARVAALALKKLEEAARDPDFRSADFTSAAKACATSLTLFIDRLKLAGLDDHEKAMRAATLQVVSTAREVKESPFDPTKIQRLSEAQSHISEIMKTALLACPRPRLGTATPLLARSGDKNEGAGFRSLPEAYPELAALKDLQLLYEQGIVPPEQFNDAKEVLLHNLRQRLGLA